MKKNNKKKKIKKFILTTLFIFIVLFVIYEYYNNSRYDENKIVTKLKELTYSNESIKLMIDKDIANYIVERNLYSKTIENALLENNFDKDNLEIYTFFEYKEEDNFIDNLNKLVDLGYSKEEIKILMDNLNNKNVTSVANKKVKESKLLDYCVLDNFIFNNYNRYIKYKEKNPNFNDKKVVSLVNINLDYEFYENTEKALNQNTSLVLVNKHYKLNSDYVPKNLKALNISCAVRSDVYMESVAKDAFEELCMDAKSLGFTVKGTSGYRSYDTQKNVYNSYLKDDPIEVVDTYSARAGHSEHQTGYALDVYNGVLPYNEFGKTDEYKWVKVNAHKYGFIIRYQKEKEHITGYKSEEWHLRYVGKEVAKYIYENNITLEEYLLNNKGAI